MSPIPNQPLRYGLSLPNLHRFEHIIRAAVEHYPTPVEVDWTVGKLRYITFISRLRDAVKFLRENPISASNSWLTPDNFSKLSALVVRPHPTNNSRLVIGDHDASRLGAKPSFIGDVIVTELQSKSQLGSSEFPITHIPGIVHNPKSNPLILDIGLDLSIIERAVISFCLLKSLFNDLPPLVVAKCSQTDKISEWIDGYDVAIKESENQYEIF